MDLYTIGHSDRSIDEFVSVLKAHSIHVLLDIRTYPNSRFVPHFNGEALKQTLSDAGIQYVWLKILGGRRKRENLNSPNTGLRSLSFRNYADYMLTDSFKQGIQELLGYAGLSRTAYMCAEHVYFRCHRMLVSDWLVLHGHRVLHIEGVGPVKTHGPLAEAQLINGQVMYPPTRAQHWDFRTIDKKLDR